MCNADILTAGNRPEATKWSRVVRRGAYAFGAVPWATRHESAMDGNARRCTVLDHFVASGRSRAVYTYAARVLREYVSFERWFSHLRS